MSAMPAFAFGRHHHRGGNYDTTIVNNSSEAIANTGENEQNNTAVVGLVRHSGGSRSMRTGNANANSTAVVVADTNIGCGCSRPSRHGGSNHDMTMVDNESYAGANTGDNQQNNTAVLGVVNRSGGFRSMTTGNANANSTAWTVADTNFSF